MSLPATHYGDLQYELYAAGPSGGPRWPVGYRELRRLAARRLEPRAYAWVAGGAGDGSTMRANRAALERWRIVPRHLRGIVRRDLAIELLGARLPAPLLLAPVGVLSIIHPDGERAVARAAAAVGVPMVLSTAASTPMEEVAEAGGAGPRWFQLYCPNDRELARSLLQRAAGAGCRAVVVTLDTWTRAWRHRDLDRGYLPFLEGEGIANYLSDPVFRAGLGRPPEEDLPAALRHWRRVLADPSLRWSDLEWLAGLSRLPLLVKGVLHPDDARAAVAAGAAGVVVSNHGGRQLSGAVGALDALPGVVDAVGSRVPVLFDSGIRSGADVVRALALGARAVLVGRPYVWGLALGGAAGVEHVLRCLLADLDITLGLSGHSSPGELSPAALARAGSP